MGQFYFGDLAKRWVNFQPALTSLGMTHGGSDNLAAQISITYLLTFESRHPNLSEDREPFRLADGDHERLNEAKVKNAKADSSTIYSNLFGIVQCIGYAARQTNGRGGKSPHLIQ